MKKLNKKSTQTMNKMVEMLEDGYVKIDNCNSAFMPVSVEQIFESNRYKIFSVAHYFEQYGDLMADPEMCFIYSKALEIFFPSYYKQDNLGIEQESVLMEGDEIKGYRAKMQADHTEFANMWLGNIRNQQNL